MLTIKNQVEVAEIYLSGDIVDDEESGFIKHFLDGDSTGYEFPAKLREQLKSIGDKAIEVHINSYGGSVFAGVAMANFIANHKGKTTCIIDGVAASIASQIFFSADECKIPANGYLMIHRPFSYVEGNADDLRKAAEVLETIQAGLETTYQKKALENVTAAEIHEMMNAETWLTGSEAATKFKVELLEPVKVLNCVGNTGRLKAIGIKNFPESLNLFSEVESRIQNALNKAAAIL